MIEKETLNLLRESINRRILQIKCLYEVLQFDVLIFLHRLNDSWSKMRLLLYLIGLPLDHLLYLLLLLGVLEKQSLSLLVSFV